MASGSDDERVDVPTDEYGIIYTREANIEAGRDVDFGHKRITLERHETFMRLFGTTERALQVAIRARTGRLTGEDSEFRSVAWRLFLGELPVDADVQEWANHIREKRDEYARLLAEYKLDPSKLDGDDDDPLLSNPLSLDKTSPWQQFYANQNLLHEIGLDLNRLYPDGCEDFFEATVLKDAIVNALFLWCRMHPDTSYRQGMHELMAPLVYTLEREKARPGDVDDDVPSSSPLPVILDPHGVEADAFWLFTAMMEDLEPLFSREGGAGGSSGDSGSDSDDEGEAKISFAIQVANRIQYERLAQVDAKVATAMQALMIQPQVYALRWMRLLFGREFPIPESLLVWDSMLSARFGKVVLGESGSVRGAPESLITTIESIAVAMLLFVRDDLLSGDYGTALARLMKFPEVADPTVLLDKAAELRDRDYRPPTPPPAAVAPPPLPARRGSGGAAASDMFNDSIGMNHRLRLIKFYTTHNPAKLGEVDTILAKYQGREVKLFTALNRRYNVEQTHNTAQAPAASTAAAPQPAFATAAAPTPAPAPSTEADNSHLKLFSSWGAGPRMHAAAPAPAPAPGLAGPTPVLGADDDARAGVGDSTDDRAAIMQLCGARLEAVVDLGPDALLFLPEIADVLLGRKNVTECDWF